MGKFRAHNRFTIVVVLPNEEFKTKFTKMVDDLFADVDVMDRSTFTGNNSKEEYPAVVIRCDSGTGLVNGTSFKWDINCDPEDEDVRNVEMALWSFVEIFHCKFTSQPCY